MYYIYCYTNLINQKKYVGQTNNIARRKSEHKYSSFHPCDKDYNSLFHQKIRQYGLNNFSFEILEEIDTEDLEYVDAREIYWIQEKNSYVKNNQGYNITLGGQGQLKRQPRKLSDQDINEIFDLLLNTDIPQKEIAKKYNVAESSVNKINKGTRYKRDNIKYPIRKPHKLSDETKNQVKELILNSNLTIKEIAKEANISKSSVVRIKASLKKEKPVSTITD